MLAYSHTLPTVNHALTSASSSTNAKSSISATTRPTITNPTITNPTITNPTITYPTMINRSLLSKPTIPFRSLTIPSAEEALMLSVPSIFLSTIPLPPSLLSNFLITELDAVIVDDAGAKASTARVVGDGGNGGVVTVSAGISAAAVTSLVGVGTTGVVHTTSAGTIAAAAKTWVVGGEFSGQKVVLVPPASGGWGVWTQGQRDGVVVIAVVAVLALMAVVLWVAWRGRERRRRMREWQRGWVPSDDDQRSSRSCTSSRKKLESLKMFKKSPAKVKDESKSESTIEGLDTIEVGPAARRAFWENLTTAKIYKSWESGIAMNELGEEVLEGGKPIRKQKKVRIDGVTVIDGGHEGEKNNDPFDDAFND